MRRLATIAFYIMVGGMFFACVEDAIALDCSRAEMASYCSQLESIDTEERNSNPRASLLAYNHGLDTWKWPNATQHNVYNSNINTLSFAILSGDGMEDEAKRMDLLGAIHELQVRVPHAYVVSHPQKVWVTVKDLDNKYAEVSHSPDAGKVLLRLDTSFFDLNQPDRLVAILHEVVHIKLFLQGFQINSACIGAFHEVMAYQAEFALGPKLGFSKELERAAIYWSQYYNAEYLAECTVGGNSD